MWVARVTQYVVLRARLPSMLVCYNVSFPDHPLLDVRARSLRSISFKLSTGLLHITDMVHERDFLAHLLEWFNFEEVVMEAQALSLISQVAEVRTQTSQLSSPPPTFQLLPNKGTHDCKRDPGP